MLKLKPSLSGLSYLEDLDFCSFSFHLQPPLYLLEYLCSTLINKHCQIKRFLVINSGNLREKLMVNHRQDIPWFVINSVHFFCSMTNYLKYTEPGVAHFLISAFLRMSHQPHLSNWTLLGMEAWVSQFQHSSMVISGCRMRTWCSLIKYCICNRVQCSLPYPCSKLPLPQEKGLSRNVGYEVLLSNLSKKIDTSLLIALPFVGWN